VKDGVLAVKDGIGELSSALDAGHVTWGEIGTAYGDGLTEVASDPAKVGKIVGSSAVSLGAGKAAAVGGKLAMAAAVQTNTARTIAVSAVLATTELAPVASGAARGGVIAAQVGKGFAKGAAAADNVATLDAAAIRFSQSNVRSSLPEIAASMKANGWQGAPIDVVRMADGTLTAVDNTRLAAAALSTTPVQATIRGFGEAFPAARAGGSLQGGTWGEALINRIGGQKPGWQRLYPNGSPFTGVHPSTPGFTP
jgi:filamentous hemagglutinin